MTTARDPALRDLLDALRERDALVHVADLPARPARYGDTSAPIPSQVWERLGVDNLWTHQAIALDLVRAGRSVVLATGTASGKSLVYQTAIGLAADAVRERADPPGRRTYASRTGRAGASATALLLSPTKALGHDQLRALTDLALPGVVPAAYDGDSTPEERRWVRSQATAIFTNPEMLHVGILPSHARWAPFLRRLRIVVLDELHVLRGVFGSHVGHVVRRLRRLCTHYGSDPVFVCCSATIGDPAVLATEICGHDVVAVTDDGSPRGPRTVVLATPPLLDVDTGTRASLPRLAADVTAQLVTGGHRTITFCRSRHLTEVVAADVARKVPPELAERVRPYRSGYLAAERRATEAALADGSVRAVVATSALELGVDIGGLDAGVLMGFPGTIASLWQQIGRVGRGTDPSVAVVLGGPDQLDQYLLHHPDEVFSRAPEPVVVNLANPAIADPELACAAYELPISPDDMRWWGELLDEGVRRLVLDDRLRLQPGRGRQDARAVWAGRGAPAPDVGLRSGFSHEVRIALDDGTLVGTVDVSRAAAVVHPGAVYLHRGQAYSVRALDYDERVALVEPDDGTTSTRATSTSDLTVLAVDDERPFGRGRLSLGAVAIHSQVTGYQRVDADTGKVLARIQLELPPSTLVTRGFWYEFDPDDIAASNLHQDELPGALHALEHAAIGMLPLFTICDRWDVGGISTPQLDAHRGAVVAVYDGYHGGAGIAELGYAVADRHLAATLALIEACGCQDGCPSCIQSPKCGNGNEPLDKHGARALLRVVTQPLR